MPYFPKTAVVAVVVVVSIDNDNDDNYDDMAWVAAPPRFLFTTTLSSATHSFSKREGEE